MSGFPAYAAAAAAGAERGTGSEVEQVLQKEAAGGGAGSDAAWKGLNGTAVVPAAEAEDRAGAECCGPVRGASPLAFHGQAGPQAHDFHVQSCDWGPSLAAAGGISLLLHHGSQLADPELECLAAIPWARPLRRWLQPVLEAQALRLRFLVGSCVAGSASGAGGHGPGAGTGPAALHAEDHSAAAAVVGAADGNDLVDRFHCLGGVVGAAMHVAGSGGSETAARMWGKFETLSLPLPTPFQSQFESQPQE